MFRRVWKKARDWGVIGNLISAAITGGLIIVLDFISSFLPFLKEPIIISIPAYLLGVLPLVILVISTLFIKIYNNLSRAYGKIYGYYRSVYEIIYFPYNRLDNGIFYEKVSRIMEFIITRDDITTIGPYFYYSYEPRGSGGIDEIVRPVVRCWVNGLPSHEICEIGQSVSNESNQNRDKLTLSIRALSPLSMGDIVRLELEYEVAGQHAAYREELDSYLHRDLKDNLRNQIQKRMHSEMVHGFIRYSAKCTIRVVFPEGFPWRHLENIEDVFIMFARKRQVEKRVIPQIAKVTATATCIEVKFPNGVGTEYSFFLFWKLLPRSVS